jgi:hypothetical protein
VDASNDASLGHLVAMLVEAFLLLASAVLPDAAVGCCLRVLARWSARSSADDDFHVVRDNDDPDPVGLDDAVGPEALLLEMQPPLVVQAPVASLALPRRGCPSKTALNLGGRNTSFFRVSSTFRKKNASFVWKQHTREEVG